MREQSTIPMSFLEKRAVSLKEAAQMLGCSIDTVRRAVKSGQMKAFQIKKQGNYRIAVDEIERLIQGRCHE